MKITRDIRLNILSRNHRPRRFLTGQGEDSVDKCRRPILRHSSKMVTVDRCSSHEPNPTNKVRSTSLAKRESARKTIKDFFLNPKK
jgi:hypothetical protein